jgi:molecular chaperone DnaJ
VERLRPCGTCGGSGARGESAPRTCPACRGAGQVRQTRATPFGQFTTVTTCPNCEGEGTLISDPCPDCRGAGRRRAADELTVEIPAGIDDGGMVRLTGEGEAGERRAPPGDLYVVAHVQPHRIFARRGRDIHCESPLPFTIAALGGTVPVPTLDGEDEIHIPAGTQTGDRFSLTGRGLPDLRTGVKGTEFITVRVAVPKRLNERQREILAQLAEESGEEIEDHKSWFQRLREALRGDEE